MPNNQVQITSLSARLIFLAAVAFSSSGCALPAPHEKSCAANCSDADISDAVRDRLFHVPSIPDTYISVSSKNGVVYLHGTVATSVERDAAVDAASRVAGVVHVVDSLEINGAE